MSIQNGLLILAISTLAACSQPTYLTYDFSRSYTAAMEGQADLTRASVQDAKYFLYGVEATDIRLRVRESATDTEGEATSLGTVGG